MKRFQLFLLGAAALLMSSCVTRIITTAEAPASTVVYTQPSTRVIYGSSYVQPTKTTTVVKTSPSRTTTTVVEVTPLGEDVSFFLDLRAVGAAFAEANSLEQFEMLLNSSTYMLSSLDLNHDGYVDYLRVVEAIDGYNHVVIIQAVLAQNIFQDVATLTVEMSYSTPYVQIIGAPYVYGPNYYVRPVFVRTPPMFARWRVHGYNPWRSPYYWDYYPHYYHKPAPVYLSHYQAYVNTYITNNKYCNHCEYDDRVHYTNYSRTGTEVTRNDYATRHPEQSFSKRVASESRSASISNARELQQRVAANTTTTTTTGTSRTSATSSSSTSRTGSTSSSSTSRTGSTTTTSSSSSRTGQTSSSSTSSTSGSSSSRTGQASTTSGSSRTSTTSGSSSSSSTRKVSPASTTTTSRVSTNGSARTTTKTINTDGSSTTTRRGEASGSTSRTSSTSSSSRTSSTSGSSRTSGSSTQRRN